MGSSVLDHPHVGHREGRDVAGDLGADGVVTAVGLTEADHEPGTRADHVRSTVRSRKWVAQEMHGS